MCERGEAGAAQQIFCFKLCRIQSELQMASSSGGGGGGGNKYKRVVAELVSDIDFHGSHNSQGQHDPSHTDDDEKQEYEEREYLKDMQPDNKEQAPTSAISCL